MPWVKIGRYRFDLDDVALVADVVGDEAEGAHRAEKGGVTITLHTQLSFDLLGVDADVFTHTFDEHVASRSIGRAPPGESAQPRIAVESGPVRPKPVASHPGNSHA